MTDTTSTPAPGDITADAEWKLHSRWGAHRFNDTPAGQLVRLADVVRWLMRAHELPFAAALERVCAELEGDAPPLLYGLSATGWAEAMDKPCAWFKFLPGLEGLADLPPQTAHARAVARNMKSKWLQNPYELARLVNEPGHPVVYREDEETPFEFYERRSEAGGAITAAVPFAVAHALWGWGEAPAPTALDPYTLGTFDNLVKYRKQPGAKSWGVGEQLAILAGEVERLGGSRTAGAVKAVAHALEITVRAVNAQLQAYKPVQKPGAGASVFEWRGKAAGS